MSITLGDIIITISIFVGYMLLNKSVKNILHDVMTLYNDHENRLKRIEDHLKLPRLA